MSTHSQLQDQVWQWQGFPIFYQKAGDTGPAIVLVHGFGASSAHWRKNMPILAQTNQVYAIDLIGFGKSAKPAPEVCAYTFETWGAQIAAFVQEIVGEPAFLIGNSIGGVAVLQAAVEAPAHCPGVILLDCALRQIHDRKLSSQPRIRRWGRPLLKRILQNKRLVHYLFAQVAKPTVVRKILLQAYGNKAAVTDELVELLLQPASEPGAADVFWAFINQFTGALPEDLLPQLSCPALILWGTDDPWEPIALGRQLANFAAVEDFIALDGVGHCPQDEVPEQVNPILQEWIARHSPIEAAVS